MNVIDWMNESAKFMFKELPELYHSEAEAVAELSEALENLREHGEDEATLLIGPYMLYRFESEGCEEVFLARQVSSVVLFSPEGVCRAYGWVDGIELDDPLDDDLDEC